MPSLAERHAVRFRSGADECAAWHYEGTSDVCIVMAGGAAVTKGLATDRFARRFHAKGYSVLAFDYRYLGESGGRPRQLVRIPDQLADWDAALACARSLPGVGSTVVWGFSLSGGHVLRAAAAHPDVAAVIAQAPLADGRASAPGALRHSTPTAIARLMARALADATGGRLARPPKLVPLAGERGDVALLTTPDARLGSAALDPDGRFSQWRQEISARTALGVGTYRPIKVAARIRCPLLVTVYEDDDAVGTQAGISAAQRAPLGEVVRLAGGHYGAFLDSHEDTVAAELDFLRRHTR